MSQWVAVWSSFFHPKMFSIRRKAVSLCRVHKHVLSRSPIRIGQRCGIRHHSAKLCLKAKCNRIEQKGARANASLTPWRKCDQCSVPIPMHVGVMLHCSKYSCS
ncbi:hypothetical protein GDO78_008139 [Eleutherodactylus coqui]|uniref:Uncharacterized protein n=1 Tax=Eleutherodactylus coqui TaxID=57060 RepID=A0A8J6FB64_ELECQ|nr:hypothetical protein GDO78_008139 [Eleutherodactylus coqui]